MNKQDINWKVSINSNYYEIMIWEKIVTEFLEQFEWNNCSLSYYISDAEINPDTIIEEYLREFYLWVLSIKNGYIRGSEWTWIYWRHDISKIWGHNINEELNDYRWKYCYLEVRKN